MAVVLINETTLTAIADAIRDKLSTDDTYQPGEMPDAIESISGGGSATLGTKTITSNATYNASSDNLDGYSSVTVNVPTGAAKSSSDLTANNLTVTAPAGLYSSDASKTLTDANLIAGNIKKDVTIFGVTGSYEGGGGGNPVYLTKVLTSTGDITVQDALAAAQYQMHYSDALVAIRANGSTAPSTGSYTLNNFWYVFENNVLKSGAHEYRSGKVAPDNIGFWISGRENDTKAAIVNGVLTSSATTNNCLGGAGTEVMILEVPFSYSEYMGQS